MIALRVEPELKKVLQGLADRERRSLNNFIVNATLTYAEEHLDADWPVTEEDK